MYVCLFTILICASVYRSHNMDITFRITTYVFYILNLLCMNILIVQPIDLDFGSKLNIKKIDVIIIIITFT